MWKVKKSKVHGSGVFATKKIKKILKLFNMSEKNLLDLREIEGLNKELKNI